MGKIVNISEDKFMKALRHIVVEEGIPDNYDPFADQKKKFDHLGTSEEAVEDGHGEIQNAVNNKVTAKGPNDYMSIVNPDLPK